MLINLVIYSMIALLLFVLIKPQKREGSVVDHVNKTKLKRKVTYGGAIA